MASLQSAPNMATGNVSLPPNLTQQHVQEVLQVKCPRDFFVFHNRSLLYTLFIILSSVTLPVFPSRICLTPLQKFRQMQEQGVRHDDPEYLKAHNLLAAVQRQQVFQKQKQLQQLQAQQRQQQQLNGTTPDGAPNGVNGMVPLTYV